MEGSTPFSNLLDSKRFGERPNITKIDLFNEKERSSLSPRDAAKIAFILQNIMSKEECEHAIDVTERIGYERTGYSLSYRSNDRCMSMETEIMDILWERVRGKRKKPSPLRAGPTNYPLR